MERLEAVEGQVRDGIRIPPGVDTVGVVRKEYLSSKRKT